MTMEKPTMNEDASPIKNGDLPASHVSFQGVILNSTFSSHLAVLDPEKKSLNFIFPTKHVISKSLKFSHWPSKISGVITLYLYHLV